LKIPEAEHGKPCNAGCLREAEGCRPYRLRYNRSLTFPAVISNGLIFYGMINRSASKMVQIFTNALIINKDDTDDEKNIAT